MMDISCDDCGKRYRVDETRMKADTAKVKCKACGNVIHVEKPHAISLTDSILDIGLPPDTDAPARPPERFPPPAAEAGRREASMPAAGEPSAEERVLEEKAYAAAATPQKVRFGLFTKTLIVMLLISILPFAIFWFITFRETDASIRSDSEALMVQTGKGLADVMDGWINANFAVLRTAAKLPDIVSMARERQEPVAKAIAREYPWMYLVFTVSPGGMNIARSDNQPLASYADRQYFKDIMAGKAISWQTVIGRTAMVPALVIAVPVKEEGRLVGVLAAAMTVEDISKQIATWKRGRTGSAFLLDEKGFVIAHPKLQMVEKRENLNTHPLIKEFRKKGWTSITTPFTDENGQPSLGHARSNSYGWTLALQQADLEVFEPLNLLQNFALALLVITAFLAAAIAWFSTRTLVRPIMRLTDIAERMSLGDLNVTVDVQSKDEIGLLAQAIGRMQTSMRMAMERLRKRR